LWNAGRLEGGFVKRQKISDQKRTKPAQKATEDSTRDRRSIQNDRRAVRNNPFTKQVIAQKAALRQRIHSGVDLAADFEFLIKKTGWDPEYLLQGLYWDSNMMHADPQAVVSKEKPRFWPIERNTLEAILKSISALVEQIERVNGTSFSPAITSVLVDGDGVRVDPRTARYLLRAFIKLPEILRSYVWELKRTLDHTTLHWPSHQNRWRSLVEHARRTSVYERVRQATPDNRYHAHRLLRLVNASREIQGLTPIEQRAFTIWLNRLRRRTSPPVR